MDLERTITDGLETFLRQPILGLPFVLSMALIGSVIVAFSAMTFILSVTAGTLAAVLFVACAFVFTLLLFMVVPSFFQAAGIRMVDKALNGERVHARDCVHAPKKGVLRLLAFNFVFGSIGLGLFAVVGGFARMSGMNIVYPLTLLWGSALMYIPYIAVLSDIDIFEMVEEGLHTFGTNWVKTLTLFIVSSQAGLVLSLAAAPVFMVGATVVSAISPIISSSVLSPINAFLYGSYTFVFFILWFIAFAYVLAPLKAVWELKLLKEFRGDLA